MSSHHNFQQKISACLMFLMFLKRGEMMLHEY
ncbi:hypothetical protein Premu_2750 [Hallella multisaccharivorax DSM 17128]|uniref:Uncharacterized protein n=1 Tax=Hallella multisaccharivorax DSM 17128 TaxID=688246 RepID=F8NCR4_9BACT|nr:hypothetical protein Premu_2750 [Hallella multisaccharivorax DSM 17128]